MSAAVATQPANWHEAWLNSAHNPWLFATGVMGYLPAGVPNPNGLDQLEDWQDQFLRDFYIDPDGKPTDSPRHSIRAGHGVGKGTTLAILALWFPLTHYDSKCVLTANSQDQLRDNNWAEIRKQARMLPDGLRSQLVIDEERLYVKGSPEMAFVVRRTASKSNPEALQGIHAKHVLYLVDEASGIPDIVFEVAQGSLSTKGAAAVLASNPTRPSGFFFDTHHNLRSRWRTVVVSCETVPRARGHIEEVVETYGKGSNRYRVRVLGEFPTSDDDTVIALDEVEAAVKRDVKPRDVKEIWGLDVARFGSDTSALARRKGNVLVAPVEEWHGKDTMQLCGLIVERYNRTPLDEQPSTILVDVIGIGAGVVDRLRELKLPVRGVNVAESPATDDGKFLRQRDELWWKGREFFSAKDCKIADDPGLIAELCGPTYDFSSSGQIVVESKKELKRRGLKSPNKADAFLLTFAGHEQRIRPRRERYRDEDVHGSAWAA